eukprot:CAMPEP_0117684024 /NCGR_PEP_ID=MMETSP0804-20121206/20817_1 /TAXON_ID=1074897 /ORGANISM="Tetraselmis astigmatica, Strain CCMP880" /LENGTH=110 /DNA_ID=CAMNT_0005494865 /DNA_START=705 /DNA_END=1037 /DNA_ORIENTATION=+
MSSSPVSDSHGLSQTAAVAEGLQGEVLQCVPVYPLGVEQPAEAAAGGLQAKAAHRFLTQEHGTAQVELHGGLGARHRSDEFELEEGLGAATCRHRSKIRATASAGTEAGL